MSFNQSKWNLCCKKEGVSYARKGTPEYERVLACYRSSSPRRNSPKRKSPSPKRPSPRNSPKRKSPSPKRPSPRRNSPKRKSPSPKRNIHIPFNKSKWEISCKKEGVNYARKGTDVYQRVLARYQDKPVVDMPLLDETNLSIDDMIVQWNEALLVNGIVVLLEGDLQVDDVIQDYVLFCEEKREQNKLFRAQRRIDLKLNREEKYKKRQEVIQKEKERLAKLSPRSKKWHDQRVNSISMGW
jgi:hypothetical protein